MQKRVYSRPHDEYDVFEAQQKLYHAIFLKIIVASLITNSSLPGQTFRHDLKNIIPPIPSQFNIFKLYSLTSCQN